MSAPTTTAGTTTAGTGPPRPVVIAGITLLAYLVLLGYELSRSSAESLFLAEHGSDALPWVWLAVAVTMAVAVTGYGRLAARWSLGALFRGAVVVSGVGLGGLAAMHRAGVPGSTFVLYVFKDVHIVIVLEILWSFANVIFALSTARWLYGLFCAAGSLGGLSGGLLSGFAAERFGTEAVLWMPVGTLALTLLVATLLGPAMGLGAAPRETARPGVGDTLRVLTRSSYLAWMVVLIALVQVVITLIDYRYNTLVQDAFADTDVRTAVIGRVYAAINVSALILQLLTGPVIRLAGVRRTLLAVPALLALALGVHLAVPLFAVMAAAKVTSKALDYSLFKSAKEMLYIPLGYAEKTRGKALVDMLTYRLAKGGASVALAGLLAVGLGGTVVWLALPLIAAWVAVTAVITRRFERLV